MDSKSPARKASRILGSHSSRSLKSGGYKQKRSMGRGPRSATTRSPPGLSCRISLPRVHSHNSFAYCKMNDEASGNTNFMNGSYTKLSETIPSPCDLCGPCSLLLQGETRGRLDMGLSTCFKKLPQPTAAEWKLLPYSAVPHTSISCHSLRMINHTAPGSLQPSLATLPCSLDLPCSFSL